MSVTYNGSFKFWCQKVLPLVYDDSLSYYELLCKVVDYINHIIGDVKEIDERITALENYVNNYFDNIDYATEINKKLDEMAENGELQSIVNGFMGVISAKAYGFKGDNATDNSDIMDKYIKEDCKTPIFFASGVYLFSRPIKFIDYMYIICSPDAYFLYTGDNLVEYFVAVDATTDASRNGCYWNNGVINANGKANIAMQISGVKYANIYPRMVLNAVKALISTGSLGGYNASGCHFHDILVWCPNSGGYNVIGIKDDTYDHFFNNIVMRDVTTGAVTTSSHFSNCQHWAQTQNIVLNSVFAVIKGRGANFVSCICDTLRTCFIFGAKWCFANISDLTIIYNRNFYTEDMMISNKPVIFDNASYSNCRINACNIHGTYYQDTYLVTDRAIGRSEISVIGLHNESGKSELINADLFDKYVLKKRYDGSSNFDNIITPGVYYINTTTGNGGVNVPNNIFGHMYVWTYDNKNIFQMCVGTGVIYTRNSSDGGENWGVWSAVKDPDPKHKVLNKRYDGSSNFNTITTAGEYYVNTDSGSGGTGVPVSIYGVLTVYRYGDNLLFQQGVAFGLCRIATRYSQDNGDTWSSWKYNQDNAGSSELSDDGTGNVTI